MIESVSFEEFSNNVKKLFSLIGETYSSFAETLGVTKQAVSQLMHNEETFKRNKSYILLRIYLETKVYDKFKDDVCVNIYMNKLFHVDTHYNCDSSMYFIQGKYDYPGKFLIDK